MSLTRTLSRLGLGKLALHLWHQPIARVRDSWRNGGPWVERATERGRQEMENAAETLPPLPSRPAAPAVTLHLLTGKRFWYQTAFCLHSFARHADVALHAEIYDDGSLTDRNRANLSRLGFSLRFHSAAEIAARLEEFLPTDKFPVLRERWRNYPNLRKLIDPHLGSHGWKLVIDSDLLFFRRPTLLLDWLQQPRLPLHATDCETSYGYSRALMNELAGAPVADLVNVGLTGFNGDELDWEKLERWCRVLIEREKTSYYLEQALVAMLVAGRTCLIAPAQDYVTLPVAPEARACRATMHHYVAHSKRVYFQHNWRRALVP
jgi:hypothetical protein